MSGGRSSSKAVGKPKGGASRKAILSDYRSLRGAVVRVTTAAVNACATDELLRAGELLRLRTEDGVAASPEDLEMLADVALFEPDGDGKRVYDRFLTERAAASQLSPYDLAVAQKLGTAFFSFFRLAGRHNVAGLWLEDLLAADRRFWIVDEGLEATAPDGMCFAARLFDAGDYHAGFGIIIHLPEPVLESYAWLSTVPDMRPTGGLLVPYIYANDIHEVVA